MITTNHNYVALKDSSVFVGRQDEVNRFIEALAYASQQTQVIYLQAGGGLGKTKLLEKFKLKCESIEKQRRVSTPIPSTNIIDFYEMENWQVDGVMQRLARELNNFKQDFDDTNAQDFFSEFRKLHQKLKVLQAKRGSPETGAILERRVEQQFIENYNDLAQWFAYKEKPIVLFFDTYESVQDRGRICFWLFNHFFPAIKNTVCAFAGRHPLSSEVIENRIDNIKLHILTPSNFKLEEVWEYFESLKISRDRFHLSNDSDDFPRIYELTKGNPLRIALVAEWLFQNPDKDTEDLGRNATNMRAAFDAQLVNSILRLDRPDIDEAIWYMAHIFHRFNSQILSQLIEDRDSESKARTTIDKLANLPFIKHRPHSNSYQLHDEMRRLITIHVLDKDDKDGKLRHDLSQRMIAYYDNEIEKLQEESLKLTYVEKDSDLKQTEEERLETEELKRNLDVFRAERLYHQFYVNPVEGYSTFKTLFEEADRKGDTPFCDLLISSARASIAKLRKREGWPDILGKNGQVKEIFIDVYEGWLDKNLGDYEIACKKLEKSLKNLRSIKNAVDIDKVANSLGYVYRVLGNYYKAQEVYEQALIANKNSQHANADMAAMILNNQGNIYRLQGQVNKALQKCLLALAIRRKLHGKSNTPNKSVANSYYILGLILRELGDNSGALRYFSEAQENFEALNLKENIANVQRWQAYIYSHFKQYDEAINLAQKSLDTLEEVGINTTHLADAYDMIGRLYRDRAQYEFKQIQQKLIKLKEIEHSNNIELDKRLQDILNAIRNYILLQSPAVTVLPPEILKSLDLCKKQGKCNTQQIHTIIEAAKLRREKQLEQAKEFIDNGLIVAKIVGDKYKEAESYLSLVRFHYIQSNYSKAHEYYNQGVEICEKFDYNLLMSYFELFDGQSHIAEKRYNEAFKHFARRAKYAVRCRAMEFGMATDHISNQLVSLDYTALVQCAGILKQELEGFSDEDHEKPKYLEKYRQLIELCEDIKENVERLTEKEM
jgi:tetratricopeptide (TPR) repeat protein